LSEEALAEAVMTGERPAHLDRCDLCAERAMVMNRWLTGVKIDAVEAAEEVFPAERLAAQQGQILRRLEQLDEPSRVLAFPYQSSPMPRETRQRRIAPVWVGVAAAAGLVIGAIGGQLCARPDQPGTIARSMPPVTQVTSDAGTASSEFDSSFLLEMDLERTPALLQDLDDITPVLAAIQSSGG
jgi:hypothetical protein